MAEYFEFHDSVLEGIEQFEDRVVLRLNAYRHFWEGDKGTGWMQRIELTVSNGAVDYVFTNFPVCIMDGDLCAESLLADASDCIGTLIPGTLTGSARMEIYLEGCEENTNEYKGMRIRGDSVAITSREPAEYVEELPAEMNPRLNAAKDKAGNSE